MRSPLLAITLLFAGCISQQTFVGPPEFQLWMRHALDHPNASPANNRFALAYHGKPEGLHACFIWALQQAESPEINVEAGEAIGWQLDTIILRIGDDVFSSALALESKRVRSAVASAFSARGALLTCPKTRRLLHEAPKIDFPMNRTYRGDYRPKKRST
jgi:hypothetical protein